MEFANYFVILLAGLVVVAIFDGLLLPGVCVAHLVSNWWLRIG